MKVYVLTRSMCGKSAYKAILIVCFLFGSLVSGFSQSWQIGAKGGISIPDLTPAGLEKTPVSRGYNTILGPDFGIFAERSVTKTFSLEADIRFSIQGGKKSGNQAIPVTKKIAAFLGGDTAHKYLYANFDSKITLSYLMIPILAKFRFDLGHTHHWQFYADGGPYAAFMLNATGKAHGTSQVYFDAEETQPISLSPITFDSTGNIKNQLHTFNLGAEVNVGLTYRCGRNLYFVEAGGNYGFLPLQKDKTDGENKTGALVFRVGYAYRLKSKDPRVPGSSSSAF